MKKPGRRLLAVWLLGLMMACGTDESTAPTDDDDQVVSPTPTPATDNDQDGFPAASDCNDDDATINPSAVELCDGIDNDCDGVADEDFPTVVSYPDQDGDGYGDSSAPVSGCRVPEGHVELSGDCDDSDAAVNPGAVEVTCNGIDENCVPGDDNPDADGDGYDVCDAGVVGADGNAADCDDGDLTVHPAAQEACDGIDNDCDGEVDEDLEMFTYYYDADNDGHGSPDNTIEACGPVDGYVAEGDDCNDADPTIHPGSVETQDGVDSDCDGYSDYVVTLSATEGPGYSGDGGNIENARFDEPHGITVDRDGNVYIADTNNNAIRMVDSDGIVTTVLGGEPGSGEGDDTLLAGPTGLASDGTSIYIADTGHHRILKWTPGENLLTIVAGTGEAGYDGEGVLATGAKLNGPTAVAISATSVLYIADTGNHIVRQVNLRAKSPSIQTIAGDPETPGYAGDGGPAVVQARLDSPRGVAVDSSGSTVYIADTGNHVIRKVARDDNIYLVAGTPQSEGFEGDPGSAMSSRFSSPTCLMVAPTTALFVCDTGNNRIREITPTGTVFTLAGNGDTGDPPTLEDNATAVEIAAPGGMALDSADDLWIADTGHSWIRKLIF